MFVFSALSLSGALATALFASTSVSADVVLCTPGSCWPSPANATAYGCVTWAGGVDAWDTCGFEGAVICNTCEPCSTDTCYTSPTQATGSGCATWAGGVDVWDECGYDGAIKCTTC